MFPWDLPKQSHDEGQILGLGAQSRSTEKNEFKDFCENIFRRILLIIY